MSSTTMNLLPGVVSTVVLCAPCLAQDLPPGVERVPAPAGVPEIRNPQKPFPLMVGDPAPKLEIREWILGEWIAALEPGKVYLIHLWATWCDPCMGVMKRLTELQNRHAADGLVIIGATSPGRTNTREAVEQFVFNPASPVGFHVAWDAKRATFDLWLNPTGRTSLPNMFIVDREGMIAYIGGLAEFETPLRQILDGTFDLDGATRRYYECVTAAWAVQHFEKRLKDKDFGVASSLGREIIRGRGRDCFEVLSNIAWIIVDPKSPYGFPDIDLALEAAQRASDLVGGTDADALDTLARAQFLKGDIAAALRTQEKAVELAMTESMKRRLAATLEEYRSAAKQ